MIYDCFVKYLRSAWKKVCLKMVSKYCSSSKVSLLDVTVILIADFVANFDLESTFKELQWFGHYLKAS
jgi:hypothetical protein